MPCSQDAKPAAADAPRPAAAAAKGGTRLRPRLDAREQPRRPHNGQLRSHRWLGASPGSGPRGPPPGRWALSCGRSSERTPHQKRPPAADGRIPVLQYKDGEPLRQLSRFLKISPHKVEVSGRAAPRSGRALAAPPQRRPGGGLEGCRSPPNARPLLPAAPARCFDPQVIIPAEYMSSNNKQVGGRAGAGLRVALSPQAATAAGRARRASAAPEETPSAPPTPAARARCRSRRATCGATRCTQTTATSCRCSCTWATSATPSPTRRPRCPRCTRCWSCCRRATTTPPTSATACAAAPGAPSSPPAPTRCAGAAAAAAGPATAPPPRLRPRLLLGSLLCGPSACGSLLCGPSAPLPSPSRRATRPARRSAPAGSSRAPAPRSSCRPTPATTPSSTPPSAPPPQTGR